MRVPRWRTVQGTGDDWFDAADYSDAGGFSIWMNGAKPPRYGWLRSEVAGVIGGWAILLVAGRGFLWSSGQRHLLLMGVCGILMFIGAALASESVPDGTTIQDTVGYLEGLHRHAWADQGWSKERMEAEFLRALAASNPRYVKGGREAILRRINRMKFTDNQLQTYCLEEEQRGMAT